MPLAAPTFHRHNGRTKDTNVLTGAPIAMQNDNNTTADYNAVVTSGGVPVYRDDGTGNIYVEIPNAAATSGVNDYVNNDSKYFQSTYDLWVSAAPSGAVILQQFRTASAQFCNLILQNSGGLPTFRARGASDGNLVNNSVATMALNSRYTVRTIIFTGTSGTSDGKMRTQLIRKSDQVIMYDQESTTQAFNGVLTRYTAIGRLGSPTGGVNIDNVQTWDNAYEFLEPLSDFATTVVNAGVDQANILPYQMVTLSGSSTGAAPTAWNWTQVAGPTVTLSGTGASRTFVAPAMPDDTTLRFSLTATTGGVTSAADTVDIFVQNHNNFKSIGGTWTGIRLNRLSV